MAGRKRDPAIDEGIVAGASALLAEGGYAAFTIEAVAARQGIPKSTIDKRWTSRARLLDRVLVQRFAMMRPIDPDDARDLRQVLAECVTDDIALSQTREGVAIAQALLAARAGQDSAFDDLVAVADRRRMGYRALLAKATERGELPGNADVDLLVDLLLGAIWGRLVWVTDTGEPDVLHLVDAVLAAAHTGPA